MTRTPPALALLTLASLVLAACRSDGARFVDAASVSFGYGDAADAAGAPAPEVAARALAAARTEAARPAALGDYARALDLALLPVRLAERSFPAMPRSPSLGPPVAPACFTARGGELRWNACAVREGASRAVVDGTLRRSRTFVAWDLTVTEQGDAGDLDVALRGRTRLVGRLELRGRAIAGAARADRLSRRSVASGPEEVEAWTRSVDVALSVDARGCPDAGTVELKELWAASPYRYGDQGARYTWAGCGAVRAARARGAAVPAPEPAAPAAPPELPAADVALATFGP